MDFLETLPPISDWNKLHPSGMYNYAPMTVRIRADVQPIKTQNHKSRPYNVDLTKYYTYCKKSNINVLGHCIDFYGDRQRNQKCMISFYFASIEDKAHFILKFK